MSCTMHLVQELRKRGFRMTPQRQVILDILHMTNGHLSPVDIFTKACMSIPGVTEATVYRTLDFLLQNDMIHASQNSKGHLVYEIAGVDHHHIICRSCGKSVEIDHSLLKNLYQQLETVSGYKLTASHISFFGLCKSCQGSNKKEVRDVIFTS